MTTAASLDPALPTLATALQPASVERLLARRLGRDVRVSAARLVRHKLGRRCLVEYDAELDGAPAVLLGKIRARRPNRAGFHLLEAFRRAGFDDHAPDGITVPEPVALLPELQMWLQRKVDGRPAAELLTPAVARRVAEAAHKVHRAGVPTRRHHTVTDELGILRACLDDVGALHPEWTERLARVADACTALAPAVVGAPACGIHRDFYADQLLVDGDRLTVVDFDLYCKGDPALDAGNFLGHVTEQSLREHGDADALSDVERALADRFVELAGPEVRARVEIYATLTLARHIYLSTKRADRSDGLTEKLLEVSEQRLGIAA